MLLWIKVTTSTNSFNTSNIYDAWQHSEPRSIWITTQMTSLPKNSGGKRCHKQNPWMKSYEPLESRYENPVLETEGGIQKVYIFARTMISWLLSGQALPSISGSFIETLRKLTKIGRFAFAVSPTISPFRIASFICVMAAFRIGWNWHVFSYNFFRAIYLIMWVSKFIKVQSLTMFRSISRGSSVSSVVIETFLAQSSHWSVLTTGVLSVLWIMRTTISVLYRWIETKP